MSLTKQVAQACDHALNHEQLLPFARWDARDGMSIRRYYRRSSAAESEISIYRDKRWTNSGGKISIELYCLVEKVQLALGGCAQSWRSPDYSQPLCHFQYGPGYDASRTEHRVYSAEDAKEFGMSLRDFLLTDGLHWFDAFETRGGVFEYLNEQRQFLILAQLQAHDGNQPAAVKSLKDYLSQYPRQIEDHLRRLATSGIITDEDCRFLSRASLQRQEVYEAQVRQWCEQR